MATAKAACTFPDEVDMPDGTTASEEEMLAGRDAVQQYMATMNEYLSCLDEESTAVPEEETPEQKPSSRWKPWPLISTSNFEPTNRATDPVAARYLSDRRQSGSSRTSSCPRQGPRRSVTIAGPHAALPRLSAPT
jgi:hypothetical protein